LIRSCRFSRRGYAARTNLRNRKRRPHFELRRIVFVQRKTAWATLPLEGPRTRGSSGQEKTPKRDRAEHGSSAQRVADRQALKGNKPHERRPVIRRRSACGSATLCHDLVPLVFARRRRRDRAGDSWFVVSRLRVSNVPIGSAGPRAAMARTSRRRHYRPRA